MHEPGEQTPKIGAGLRVLKIVVVAMGVLIIAGTTALVVLIGRGLGGAGGFRTERAASLEQPAGSRIVAMTRVANGLALALHGGGEADRILVIDPATGTVLMRIAVAR